MKGGKASLISEHGRKEQVEVALDSFWRLLFSWKHTARHLFSFRATCLCLRKFCKYIQKHSMKSFCPSSSIFRPLWFSAIFVLLLLLLLSGIIHLAQARPSGNDMLCWRQKTSLFCLFLPNFQTVFFKFLHAATLLVSKVTVFCSILQRSWPVHSGLVLTPLLRHRLHHLPTPMSMSSDVQTLRHSRFLHNNIFLLLICFLG